MKVILSTSLFAGVALICGCAHDGAGPSRQPLAGAPKGTLMVYSPYYPNPDFNYCLFSSEGKVLQTVYHSPGGVNRRPAQLELPIGEYRVMAWAEGYTAVTVPVVILHDQVTGVQLGGNPTWPNSAALLESNPALLPKGTIDSWRVNPAVTVAPVGVVNPPGVVSPPAFPPPSVFNPAAIVKP